MYKGCCCKSCRGCKCPPCNCKEETPCECPPLPPLPCGCFNCRERNKKAKGKFRIEWSAEIPYQNNCEPDGWQVEFCDTAEIVIARCRQLIGWVTSPPIPRCALQPLDKNEEYDDDLTQEQSDHEVKQSRSDTSNRTQSQRSLRSKS